MFQREGKTAGLGPEVVDSMVEAFAKEGLTSVSVLDVIGE